MATEATRKPSNLSQDEAFFWRWAGWSYDPKTETRSAGRARCARSLALAELAFMRSGATIEWGHDEDGASDLRCDKESFETCECARIVHEGRVLAALGAITDADDNYRRVIRAELAVEAIDALSALAALSARDAAA